MTRLLRRESGYSMVELLVVMVTLSIVLTGLTTVFVSGSNAELDLNNRFQAQSQARLGLDKLRREVHGACTVASGYSTSSVSFVLGANCPSGAATVTWCTRGSGSRYALYRVVGTTCTGGDVWIDYLTTGNVLTYTSQNNPAGSYSLARLHVDFPVNQKGTSAVDAYDLADDVVLRNSPRQ